MFRSLLTPIATITRNKIRPNLGVQGNIWVEVQNQLKQQISKLRNLKTKSKHLADLVSSPKNLGKSHKTGHPETASSKKVPKKFQKQFQKGQQRVNTVIITLFAYLELFWNFFGTCIFWLNFFGTLARNFFGTHEISRNFF